MTPPRRSDRDEDVAPQGYWGQWGQLVLKATTTTAVIVIAGFLVWRMASGFDLFAAKMDALTVQHAAMSHQHVEMQQQASEARVMTRRMLVVLRVMCINAARTEQARQSCLQEDTIP